MNCYVFELPLNGEMHHVLTPLTAEQLGDHLYAHAVAGHLIQPLHGPQPENIAYNPEFLVVLHETVRDCMVNDSQVTEEAAGQLNGFVFIVDRRAPRETDIPKEDIIGIFLVSDRKTDPSRYRPNPDYRLVTARGFAQLPEVAEAVFLQQLLQPRTSI